MATTKRKEDQTKGTGGKVIIPANQRNSESASSGTNRSDTEDRSLKRSAEMHGSATQA